MSRTLILVAFALLLVGCTRYGTRANGPFSPRTKSNPAAPIPPAPPPNSSPLALATDVRPEPPRPPSETAVVPPRLPEPVALDTGFDTGVIPAGGISAEGDAAFPPIRRRKPDPQPSQLPSPFAPKNPSADAPNTPGAPPSSTVPNSPKNIPELKKVVQVASERWAKADTYEATITRRELTPKGINSEVLLFQYRKEPMSLFTRNLGENGKNREVVYNPSKYGDKLHVMLGEGDNMIFRAGFKAPPIALDDPRVTEKARYSVRDSGFGYAIGRIADCVAKYETGKYPAEMMTFLGPVNRPEFKEPLVGIQLKLRPGDDPTMPTGGVRQWLFDMNPNSPAYGLPVVMLADDPKGNSVEYYLFEKVKMPAGLTEADFTPDRLGKKK